MAKVENDRKHEMSAAIAEASSIMRKGEWETASNIWNEIIEEYPSIPRGVYARLAASYGKLGKYDDAKQVMNDARRRDMVSPQLVQEVVKSYSAEDKLGEARDLIINQAKITNKADEKRQYLNMVASIDANTSNEISALKILNGLIESFEGGPLSDDVKETAAFVTKRVDRMACSDAWENYWRLRKKFVYLHICRRLIEVISSSASVVADIGSNKSPILDFYGNIEKKFSVDITSPYKADDVISVKEDFYVWEPPVPIQVASCFQVIEHVPDPAKFSKRILELSEVSIVSVPYKEPAGVNPGHINNDIDLDTIKTWFGRPPNFHYIATELSGNERIICVFDNTTEDEFPNMHEQGVMAQKFMYRWTKDKLA